MHMNRKFFLTDLKKKIYRMLPVPITSLFIMKTIIEFNKIYF